MFSKGGPWPWETKKGHSKLDQLIEEAAERKLSVSQIETERLRNRLVAEGKIPDDSEKTGISGGAEHIDTPREKEVQ